MNFIKKVKKSLGQNFLTDKNIVNKIVEIGNIEKNKTVLEIGPGYGSLTRKILSKNPKKIFAIEKDKNLSSFLINTFKDFSNIRVINNDILDIIGKKNFGQNVLFLLGLLKRNTKGHKKELKTYKNKINLVNLKRPQLFMELKVQ